MAQEYYSQTRSKYLDKLENILEDFPECAKAFIYSKSASYKASTRFRYCEDLNVFFRFIVEAVPSASAYTIKELPTKLIAEIKPETIDHFMNYIERYEYEGNIYHNDQAAKKRKLATLRSFYKFMFARGLSNGNPASLVDSPKLDKKDIIALDHEDRLSVIASVTTGQDLTPAELKKHEKKSVRDTAIVYLLLGTGIRVSELVGLDLKDVNLRDHRINIIRKGGNQDHVYFNDEVCEVLENYMLGERKTVIPAEKDKDALFISQKQTRISVSAVERLVKKYARGTQYGDKVTPHKLRSSFATAAVSENDLSAVAAALGHQSSSTTAKYYTKVTEEAKRHVAKTSKIE